MSTVIIPGAARSREEIPPHPFGPAFDPVPPFAGWSWGRRAVWLKYRPPASVYRGIPDDEAVELMKLGDRMIAKQKEVRDA